MTTAILTAFLERLDSFVYSPQPPVLWPGINSTPPESGAWLEASLFPSRPENLSWGNDSADLLTGYGLVMVGYRPGAGEIVASELADAILDHFAKGTVLGPVRVLRRGTRSPASPDEGARLFIPVTIPYIGITS